MSTKFTFDELPDEIELPLGQLLISAHQWVTQGLVHLMKKRGHSDLASAHLTFLSNLDCGVTHASAVARRMGISRQGVYKSTRELQRLGVLELKTDPDDKRQKIISMTKLGEKVANDARASLAEVEALLCDRIGESDLAKLSTILGLDWGPVLADPRAK